MFNYELGYENKRMHVLMHVQTVASFTKYFFENSQKNWQKRFKVIINIVLKYIAFLRKYSATSSMWLPRIKLQNVS